MHGKLRDFTRGIRKLLRRLRLSHGKLRDFTIFDSLSTTFTGRPVCGRKIANGVPLIVYDELSASNSRIVRLKCPALSASPASTVNACAHCQRGAWLPRLCAKDAMGVLR